jgi:hypothetical protein
VDAAQVRVRTRHRRPSRVHRLISAVRGCTRGSWTRRGVMARTPRISVHLWRSRHASNRRTGPPGAHRLSLIRSLIQLRPETFDVHHAGQATEVTNPLDLPRTQPRRLGKRVGDSGRSLPPSSAAQAPGVRPQRADPARCGQDGQPSEPRHESTVLTDLLTTTLDHHGHGRTEKPSEQGRRDCLDSRGRP